MGRWSLDNATCSMPFARGLGNILPCNLAAGLWSRQLRHGGGWHVGTLALVPAHLLLLFFPFFLSFPNPNLRYLSWAASTPICGRSMQHWWRSVSTPTASASIRFSRSSPRAPTPSPPLLRAVVAVGRRNSPLREQLAPRPKHPPRSRRPESNANFVVTMIESYPLPLSLFVPPPPPLHFANVTPASRSPRVFDTRVF